MSAPNERKLDSEKETWSWLHCRRSKAHSSRLFVIVVGVVFFVLGSVLLSQYSTKKLRDFLILGVGMLVVGVAFIVIVTLVIFGDSCTSLCVSIKEIASGRRRVSDVSSLHEPTTPCRVPIPDNIYENGPSMNLCVPPQMLRRDPSIVGIDAAPGVIVCVPQGGSTVI